MVTLHVKLRNSHAWMKWGKFQPAKLLWFQPHEDFHMNISGELVSYAKIIKISGAYLFWCLFHNELCMYILVAAFTAYASILSHLGANKLGSIFKEISIGVKGRKVAISHVPHILSEMFA